MEGGVTGLDARDGDGDDQRRWGGPSVVTFSPKRAISPPGTRHIPSPRNEAPLAADELSTSSAKPSLLERALGGGQGVSGSREPGAGSRKTGDGARNRGAAESAERPAGPASIDSSRTAFASQLTMLDLERAKEQARVEERAVLRERLVESSALAGAAAEAALSLDESLGGGVLSPHEAYEHLVRERVVSAALQVKLDDVAEQQARQLETERRAFKALLEQRTQALEASYRGHVEQARRRCRLMASQVSQQATEISALKSLNSQLLNEADPLLLDHAKINWPRPPTLHPPSLELCLGGPIGPTAATATAATGQMVPAPPPGPSPLSPASSLSPRSPRSPRSPWPQSATAASPTQRLGNTAARTQTGHVVVRRQTAPIGSTLEAVIVKRLGSSGGGFRSADAHGGADEGPPQLLKPAGALSPRPAAAGAFDRA